MILNNYRRPNFANASESNGFLGSYDGILCFGGEDWWYHNRAHFDMQIMRCIAVKVPVLYINSVGFSMPSFKETAQFFHKVGRKFRSVSRPLRKVCPGFHVASPFSVPLWHRPAIARLNVLSLTFQISNAARFVGFKNPVLWVACPTAYEIVKRMKRKSFLVYQRTDKYEEYSTEDHDYITAADKWLANRADLIIYASRVLYEEEARRNANTVLIGHGVDLVRFDRSTALRSGTPAEFANIKSPIAGFFGDVESNFLDMSLIEATACALPEVSFVFVGRVIADVGSLRKLPNVHFFGQKPYEEVPRYGARFDVAIMPWQRNRWIHYCNPIKLKEYLALGLPIVSTEFPEAIHYSDVLCIARSANDFIEGIRDAIRGCAPASIESRRQRVADDTWQKAALSIAEIIGQISGEKVRSNNADGLELSLAPEIGKVGESGR